MYTIWYIYIYIHVYIYIYIYILVLFIKVQFVENINNEPTLIR